MLTATKTTATVQDGGRIEVHAPEIPTGQTVEVIILSTNGAPRKRSVLDILAECPGGQLFKTADEVDRYIREERDAWDR